MIRSLKKIQNTIRLLSQKAGVVESLVTENLAIALSKSRYATSFPIKKEYAIISSESMTPNTIAQ